VSWKQSTIGEVLTVIKNGVNCEQNKIPVGDKITRIETIAKQSFDFNRVGYAHLSESEKVKGKIRKGDILFSHINSPIHVGKTAIYESDEDLFHGINLLLLRTIDAVNPYFFNLYLNHLFITGYWEENCKKSVNQASVNQKDISKVKFNYPSLLIQQKIIFKLNAIFSEIDKAAVAAETNAKNSEALFQSYLTQVFERGGEDWLEKKLHEITTKIGSGATPKGGNESYKETGISLIRSMNVYDEGFYFPKLAFIDELQAKELANVKVEKDDVLLNITGASVARCCVVPSDILPARVNQHVSILRAIKSVINPYLLHYLLISPFHKRRLLSVGEGGGTTRQAITKAQLQEYSISFPVSQDSQIRLIEMISELYTYTEKIKNSYKQKINNLLVLKQSILKRAFTGDLIKEH
jgi:type I restriction enzyme S subunit